MNFDWRAARWWVLLGAVALGCAHDQEDGDYVLTAEEIIRDTCQILEPSPSLWSGTLKIDGEIVRLKYALFDTELRGQFREVTDSFYLDGSAANVTQTVRGEQCLFDLVTIHIDGNTDPANPRAFTGSIRIDYQSRRRDPCNCELSARFRAVKQ